MKNLILAIIAAASACTAHAGNPCPGPDGDGNCSESCNEAADNCTAPDPNGSTCADGLFCNGTDTCASGTCSAHSGDPCAGGSDGTEPPGYLASPAARSRAGV